MSELLLIDDDTELCDLLSRWLSQEGFQISACHDAHSARALLAQSSPDAVILDVMLPDGSGLDLLKHLRREHPELPVLMLSTYPDRQYAVRSLKLGATGYLNKSADSEQITTAVRRAAIRLAKAGKLVIYRKGKPVDPRAFRGVYRLGLPRDE